jgi:hypothetical protein
VVQVDARPGSAFEGDHSEWRSLQTTIARSCACEELTHSVFDHSGERVPTRSCVHFEISQQAVIKTDRRSHRPKHQMLVISMSIACAKESD